MRLTKHAHACVTVEKDGTRLVIDPGTLTPDAAEAVARADAVLVTHEHFDHFDEKLIAAALAVRPELRVYGTAAVARALGGDERVRIVTAGDTFAVGPVAVAVHGHRHAPIHADVPRPDNVGYLLDGGALYHPGDAYHVPDAPVRTLLLPTSGPWTKLGEAADYVRAVRPGRVVQIHELMLSELGQTSTARLLGEQGLTGVPVTRLAPGATLTL